MQHDIVAAPFEFKFASDTSTGKFSGYGAIFGNQDGHGDVIAPGAFADSIAERKAAGRGVSMHVMHGVFGGDGLPVGVWSSIAEDSNGLAVEGKISGMNTDQGRLLYERVKDGALGGLSIGYTIKKNGAVYGTKAGEPKRTLKALNLHEISLVDDPSNALARVTEMKLAERRWFKADPSEEGAETPAEEVAEAMRILDGIMQGGGYGSVKDLALLMQELRDAYFKLTGSYAPDDLEDWKKNIPTIREIEKFVRDEFKLSHSQARAIVERGFKALPREEGSEKTAPDGAADLLAALRSFQPSS